MNKGSAFVLGTLFCLVFTTWGAARWIADVSYERGCGGHLKRAADANTIQLAERELAIAVRYLEANRMTEGYTSIFFTTPDEDVGFWYQNLKSSLDELQKMPTDASRLEVSNTLLKLRETLLDHHEKGETVTQPPGIYIFPYNAAFAVWGTIGFLLLFPGLVCIAYACRPQ